MQFENVKPSGIIIHGLNPFYKTLMSQIKVLLMKGDTVKHTTSLSN